MTFDNGCDNCQSRPPRIVHVKQMTKTHWHRFTRPNHHRPIWLDTIKPCLYRYSQLGYKVCLLR